MTASHRQAIADAVPEAADKLVVLGISDPYGMELDAYRACLAELERFFEAELPHILSEQNEGDPL